MNPKPRHVTYRAFAPSGRGSRGSRTFALPGTQITVEGADGQECERRITAICRDCGFPIRRTLATMRRVRLRALV